MFRKRYDIDGFRLHLTGTYTPVTTGSGMTTNVYTTPGLTTTSYFRALVSYNGCSAATPGYAVAQKVIAGTIAGGTVSPATVCNGTAATLTLTGYTGSVIQWKICSTPSGVYTDITGATSSSYNPNTTLPLLSYVLYYKAAVSSPGCVPVLTPAAAVSVISCGKKSVATEITPGQFEVTAYPNPFGESFKLDLTTSSDERVELRVYDMIGRMIEIRQVNVSDLSNQEVGNNYPSGVYNMVVSQGANVKTLRVIRR